jgi:hypothetical protein
MAKKIDTSPAVWASAEERSFTDLDGRTWTFDIRVSHQADAASAGLDIVKWFTDNGYREAHASDWSVITSAMCACLGDDQRERLGVSEWRQLLDAMDSDTIESAIAAWCMGVIQFLPKSQRRLRLAMARALRDAMREGSEAMAKATDLMMEKLATRTSSSESPTDSQASSESIPAA